jgi:hypothetical protein
MPVYVIERLIEPETFAMGPRLSQKAMRLINDQFPDLVWLHSHVVEADETGAVRTFCVYESPNEELVRGHNEAIGGVKIVNIYQLAGDVAPADIPPEGEPTADGYFS